MTEAPKPPSPDDAQAKKDAAAFAGGCLAGLGTVGLVATTVVVGIVAVAAIALLLVFLACTGAFG